MKTITSVEPQKKNSRRFNIFLNGEFAFGADEDTVVNFRLLKGKQITDEDLDKILQETEVGRIMEKMYRLFSLRQRSEKEVRDYFVIKNAQARIKDREEITSVLIELVIDRLKQKELLNDREFAIAWTQARRKSHKKGLQLIKSELYKKGISREIVEEVLANANSDGEDENSLALQAIEKKARVWRGIENNEFKQKGLEFLLRRGFSYDTAKTTVEKFLGKDYNNS